MRVLIFGVTGMLGSTLYKFLSKDQSFTVFGTAREYPTSQYFTQAESTQIFPNICAENIQSVISAFIQARPDVVINCIGLVKQLKEGNDPLSAILINAQFPHQLSQLCKLNNSRFIHISTDCVFSGKVGNYTEEDLPDAQDIYGRSKLLGEVLDSHALTIRTSIIGHELSSKKSLLEWFLSQEKEVKGYNQAIFSGLPTLELSQVIKKIIAQDKLTGLYHVASKPINKFDLLQLIAKIYRKSINIICDQELRIDRSLCSARFEQATGYIAPSWPELVENMYAFSGDLK